MNHTYRVILTARCVRLLEAPSPQSAQRQAAALDPDLLTFTHVRVADVELQLRHPRGSGIRQRDDFGQQDLEEAPHLDELAELKHAA